MLLLSLVGHAWAADSALPFEAHFSGSAQCAPAAFRSEIAHLSQHLRPPTAGEPALDFSVQVDRTFRTFSGSIRVRGFEGNETKRAVEGASCEEVLSALALIAVMLVDPNAAKEPRTVEQTPMRVVPHTESKPDPTPARPWRFGAGVGAGVETAIAPDPVATGSIQLEAVLGGEGTFSPRVAVALERSAGDTVSTPAGNAHFGWTAARVSACPARFPSSGRFALRPCLSFDVGAFDVTGEQTYRPSSTRLTWFALGGAARAEYSPMTPLTLGLDAGVVAPLVRDRFYFDPGGPDETLRVPTLGLSLRAGLAVFFE